MNFENNTKLNLAYKFVTETNSNIFLTGKAGTGKTTFLKFIKENSNKRTVVVAPTGVAAINAGGVTIHSFFQLSFGPQLPGKSSANNILNTFRFNKTKINIIKSIDLLVIDEISMVRADLLDAIDKVLCRFRNTDKPFGGVQLLMIGDLQQLSPVIMEDEWKILADFYDTPFFFSSRALKKTDYVTIELQHVYRQKDEEFLELLNKIRDNKIDERTIEKINKRFIPGFNFEQNGYITLTTHNAKADKINTGRLNKIKEKPKTFKAKISGNFPEYAYPTDETLTLKKGAQVMFVKNDQGPLKRFYNGKIGKVVGFEKSLVKVQCEGDENPILVEPLEWEKTKYTLNKKTKEITEETEGTFTQIPLKLAWAVTIHKSQGLTFDKVIIDANEAFAHGQVYVALSRCTSLEGIVLKSPLHRYAFKQDKIIKVFSDYYEKNQPDNEILKAKKKAYEKELLSDIFTFDNLKKQVYYLKKLSTDYETVILSKPKDKFLSIIRILETNINDISLKFKKQLDSIISKTGSNAENDKYLQERIKKGSEYFLKYMLEIVKIIEETEIVTDNKEVELQLNKALKKLYSEVIIKKKLLEKLSEGFTLQEFLKERALILLEEPVLKKKKAKISASCDIPHPELYSRLKEWRNSIARDEGKPVYLVLPTKTIEELCKNLPVTIPALKAVKGFGDIKVNNYGDEIISIISDYLDETGFEAPVFIEPEPKKKKTSSKEKVFNLWKNGKDKMEIAKELGLAENTITGHIAQLISEGKIAIEELMEKEKIDEITEYFLKSNTKYLKDAKEHFGAKYDYEELRYVLNHVLFIS